MPRADRASRPLAVRALRFLALAVALLVGWRLLLGQSVRRDADALRRAVRDHCRQELGLPSAWRGPGDFETAFRGCEDFEVVSAGAAGGLRDPVMVRIAIRRGEHFPLAVDTLSLRHALLSMPVVASLGGLASGRWEWNPGVAYSDFRFVTSF